MILNHCKDSFLEYFVWGKEFIEASPFRLYSNKISYDHSFNLLLSNHIIHTVWYGTGVWSSDLQCNQALFRYDKRYSLVIFSYLHIFRNIYMSHIIWLYISRNIKAFIFIGGKDSVSTKVYCLLEFVLLQTEDLKNQIIAFW